ncbi:MAG TPA: NTP transferase domain-containing protein [Burkholderiales bacterium]|nr:NTP transferase domain-containing protein [Burkholderiales bacterium]
MTSRPQIVIPMSGFGERFRRAGYAVPKPLVEIDGKPVIAHVVGMFPGEADFLFICNQAHLDEPAYRMRETLAKWCPEGRVAGIPPHKLGPVHAVLQVADRLDPARPVVVNYCDFCCYWDWSDFRSFVAETRCAGAIPAYRGFHPHSLGTTNYAYLRETGGWVEDIREKQPFTSNRLQEYASSGTYYFADAALMQRAFVACREQGLLVGGELYVSLAYQPLLAEGARVAVYELQHFMQWGTPEDVAEYRMWSGAFRRLVDPAYAGRLANRGCTLVPMAGLGERFAREGYATAKPLIPVSGRPMVLQAVSDLPESDRHVFVVRDIMSGCESLARAVNEALPNSRWVTLAENTDGQARSALIGYGEAGSDVRADEPLTVAACDSGALYRREALRALIEDADADLLVWTARGYPNAVRNPSMYGWLIMEGTEVRGVSVKVAPADPASSPVIIGTFTFRRAGDFERAVRHCIERGARVNGEFYLDSCVEDALLLGLRVRVFDVDNWLCWGTPDELRTFEYWQSCFHKWRGHPYRLENDPHVPREAVRDLDLAYGPVTARRPILDA